MTSAPFDVASYVRRKFANNTATGTYTIGQEQDGWLPSFDSPTDPCINKLFTATYRCGNNSTIRNVTVPAPALGQISSFDCAASVGECGANLKITLLDTGSLTLTNVNDETTVIQSTPVLFPTGGSTSLPMATRAASQGKNGRNYLLGGESLLLNEFIGSPTGVCYLIMTRNAQGQPSLEIRQDVEACTSQPGDNSYMSLYTTPLQDHTNVGKIGYVSEDGKLHEYPSSMRTSSANSSNYIDFGNFSSLGNDLQQSNVADLAACRSLCTGNAQCAGFEYKNSNPAPMPVGIRFIEIAHATPDDPNASIIQISQLAVYARGVNVAPSGTATAKYDDWNSSPIKAIDGVLEARNHPGMYHTSYDDRGYARHPDDVWNLDLGTAQPVTRVVYYNRRDCCQSRANGLKIRLLDESRTVKATFTLTSGMVQTFNVDQAIYEPVVTTNCNLKTSGMFPKGLRQSNENYQLFGRGQGLINNASCSKEYQAGTNSQWQALQMGSPMSMNTLCNLAAYTQNEMDVMQGKQAELSDLAENVNSTISGLVNTDKSIYATLKNNVQRVKHNIKQYENVLQKRDMHPNQVQTVDGMREDTTLTVKSAKVKTILWALGAFAVVLLGIRFVRKNNGNSELK